MNSSKPQRESSSQTPEEDAKRDERNQSRVNRTHGGNLLEAVAPEELEPMNDPNCPHTDIVRDETETDFIAWMCANPKCGVVVLYDK